MHRRRLVGHRSWHHRLLFSSGRRIQLRLTELQRGRRGLPNTYNKTPRTSHEGISVKKKMLLQGSHARTRQHMYACFAFSHTRKRIGVPLPFLVVRFSSEREVQEAECPFDTIRQRAHPQACARHTTRRSATHIRAEQSC